MPKPTGPIYQLRLTPTGDGPPPIRRLQAALKCLLRSFGLRCVSVTEVQPEPSETDQTTGK